MLGDGKVALGVTVGVIFVVMAYLALEVIQFEHATTNYLELAAVVVSLLVALTSTSLAANALLEQRKVRETGTDPVLVAHLGQREDAKELVTFNLSNIGAGAALKVHFLVESPSDEIERNLVTNIFKSHHPFAVILQGKTIEYSLAVGWELLGDKLMPPFQVSLEYEDLAGGQYSSEFTIDVRELEGLPANQTPQMRMVKALEKIAKNKV